ncbi:SRPBCC family protein [Macrococcoides canis]|uniref:SRPBCC family protein n=1 Tax=Macrococcoides canis TaxID=1855823 RepID=A0AAE6WZ41_9STAP|nr:SRPBCC family protein [Macrococcus canis]QIH77491.1 SRPBCC family protein [Macrococcus canis]
MLTWKETMIIPANIETIWHLFDINQMQRIMPQVIDMRVIDKKPGVVGSTYEQTYKEGKRIMKYIVTDLEHEGTPSRKHNRSGFKLANMFTIEADYVLERINDHETRFTYSSQNEGINLLGKIMLKVMPKKQNDKVVQSFMERVYTEATKEQS